MGGVAASSCAWTGGIAERGQGCGAQQVSCHAYILIPRPGCAKTAGRTFAFSDKTRGIAKPCK